MEKVKVGIVGAAGFTGGELLRLLLLHPQVRITFAMSRSHATHPVHRVHPDLLGETNLKFSEKPGEADVVFLCMGHGQSAAFLQEHPLANRCFLIDLSHDFRLAPEGELFTSVAGRNFVYGLPEANRELIQRSQSVANPGCFATAIQLALLPMARASGLPDEVHVSAITGATGAGAQLQPTTSFSWRSNNISVYKPFQHQHLAEIGQTLARVSGNQPPDIHFLPYRGNFTRGILASVYFKTEITLANAVSLYKNYYKGHPFVHISERETDLKQVVNTNKCILGFYKEGPNLLVTSSIDNLIKGASGQAIQNMNLMLGLAETTGLKLKSIAF